MADVPQNNAATKMCPAGYEQMIQKMTISLQRFDDFTEEIFTGQTESAKIGLF